MADSFQRVPWRSLKPTISGPKPTENVKTLMPTRRATQKWPSSWKENDDGEDKQEWNGVAEDFGV